MSNYQAMCDDIHPPTVGWIGPERQTEDEAKQDAKKHKEDTFDHEVEIVYNPL